ncbi:MAG: hypothetical protein IJO82_04805 [Clostridia bacterium]|nr:hypothetical protein [Clostridia bacterium]
MVTDHQALAQAIQEYDELNQKTAALPAFRRNRRSYFARFSFIFLERPPVHPLFAVTGGLFPLTHPSRLPKRPPVYPLYGVTGGLLPIKALWSRHLPPDFLFPAVQAVNGNRSLATMAESHLFF